MLRTLVSVRVYGALRFGEYVVTHRPNPFVGAAPPEEPATFDIPVDIMGDRAVEHGASSPELLGLIGASDASVEWPRTSFSDPRTITVFGRHGRAGASTVAALFGDTALDAGQGFPVATGWARPLPTLNVIAVARTHFAGLTVADEFTQAWATGELTESNVLGLILIDDGPHLISDQKRMVKRLLKKTPKGGHIPWQEEWRHNPPDPSRLPLRIKRMIQTFQKTAQNGDERA